MNLRKENWTKDDLKEFDSYLLSFSKGKEKSRWEQRIVNTALPCIAIPSPVLKNIVKEISKGNIISYLDFWVWDNLSYTFINGGLITQIKDFDLMKKYLLIYLSKVDNWASVDTLKFKIKKEKKEQYFSLSKELIQSKLPFVRRAGVIILFKFVDDDIYMEEIFKIMNSFLDEEEYYVNMAVAWLFAECFTKQKEKTIEFLRNHRLNKFTINKGISKCRDSFRVSEEDKKMLVAYRIRN